MKKYLSPVFVILSTGVAGLALAHQELDINLSDVPAVVIEAARNAKPGIELSEAEKITDNGKISYELEGRLGNEEFEMLISQDGKLIEIELEDD